MNKPTRNVLHIERWLLLVFTALLVGCGGSAPSPTDADVQKLTLQICDELIRDQLILVEGPNNTGMTVDAMQRYNGIAPKYAVWNEMKDQHEGIKAAVEAIDQTMSTLDLSLSAIRVLSKDDDTKRTEFAAQLQLGNGKNLNIQGSAQYTEDGQVYVEVALLE